MDLCKFGTISRVLLGRGQGGSSYQTLHLLLVERAGGLLGGHRGASRQGGERLMAEV
jgi:hypothetical protein